MDTNDWCFIDCQIICVKYEKLPYATPGESICQAFDDCSSCGQTEIELDARVDKKSHWTMKYRSES